jgi:hypothetical protein
VYVASPDSGSLASAVRVTVPLVAPGWYYSLLPTAIVLTKSLMMTVGAAGRVVSTFEVFDAPDVPMLPALSAACSRYW